VVLLDTPPPDEPLVLRLDPARVGARILQLRETGEYLVHVPSLRALAGVHVADELPADELEASPMDYAASARTWWRRSRLPAWPVTTPAGAPAPPPRPV
jgi:hypothetical protein